MKNSIILLIKALLILSCSTTMKDNLWVNDFELLKKELTTGYANLKFSIEENNIDLIELNRLTINKLRSVNSKKEAQGVIVEFLKNFDDGHLKAIIWDKQNETAKIDYPLNTDNSTIALGKMNFREGATTYRVKYDSLAGFYPLKNEKNPFPAGIVKSGNDKIGILRIEYFTSNWYWEAASNVWESYRKEFKGECNDGCQEIFTHKIESQLEKYIIERIEELNSENVSSLLVDITGNGGGTEWAYAVANLLTVKKLEGAPFYFAKHAHWLEAIKNDIKLIEQDIANPIISPTLQQKLKQFKELANKLIEKTKFDCSSSEVWEEQNLECLKLVNHPYRSALPFEIMDDPQFDLLKSKEILNFARFIPYKKGIFSGPLYIAQDRYTASAAEGFASLLQINQAATIIGEQSFGIGCGYTNGGISIELPNIGLSVRMPDCVRYRKDGENERKGITPDILLEWDKEDSMEKRGEMLIQKIINVQYNN